MKGLTRTLLLCQVIVLSVLFLLSFFLHIPLFINYADLDGKCILFADGSWTTINQTDKNDKIYFDVRWGPRSACDYTLFVGVVTSLLAMFYIFWETLYLTRGVDNSRPDGIVASSISWIMCALSFITAVVFSVGLSHWCLAITSPHSHNSCKDNQSIHFLNGSVINPSRYYTYLQISQFGTWSVWLGWLAFGVVCLIKNSRHKREADFLVTLGKERERLLESFSSGNELL